PLYQTFVPTLKKPFFSILGKARPSYFSPIFAQEESTKQAIVHLRVLKEMTGLNSLQLPEVHRPKRSALSVGCSD
ncbi:MAG TPA: hypothetical protein VGK21_01915, partial [Candidatus Angelobacter sp.]